MSPITSALDKPFRRQHCQQKEPACHQTPSAHAPGGEPHQGAGQAYHFLLLSLIWPFALPLEFHQHQAGRRARWQDRSRRDATLWKEGSALGSGASLHHLKAFIGLRLQAFIHRQSKGKEGALANHTVTLLLSPVWELWLLVKEPEGLADVSAQSNLRLQETLGPVATSFKVFFPSYLGDLCWCPFAACSLYIHQCPHGWLLWRDKLFLY